MVKKLFSRFYVGIIILFLYAPILILIVLSFNQSKSRSKWGGFTFHWYQELFRNEDIMSALTTTLIIAFSSALIATIIGTAAAIAINSMKRTPRTVLLGITNIPMLNADIVTGISLMLIFVALNFTLGFFSVLLAHITFNIPYVILSVMPKLRQLNPHTFEAAQDLGASPFYAFFKVILPDIFPITHFTKGPEINTLSTKIYTEVRKGIKPEIYALSTLMFLTVLILLIFINRRNADKNTPMRKL
ncbi:MAG: putative rane protein [Herbinix sp.]|nr:putative rane protein [Herbinix sp.]